MGKLNSSKRYLYIANGAGLSPNINGLRFYDSGLTYYTNKIFYDETNTYAMWISPYGYWYIALISADRNFPGNAFAKVVSNSGEPPTGNYIGANGYSGTVNISLYTSNKNISIKKQNITVSGGVTNPNPDGIYILQDTLINGNKWYFKNFTQTTPILRIIKNPTVGFWYIQFLLNSWITLYTSTNFANNAWEAIWPNNLQVSLGSGGKLNLNKKYLYKATGTGLTPNIDGLRFYLSGINALGYLSFRDETNTYELYYTPFGAQFAIRPLPFSVVTPPTIGWTKGLSSNPTDPPTGNYTQSAGGYNGIVIISEI